jgi:sigma-B regulation protein RsbU (phosphoserine phosphatase)
MMQDKAQENLRKSLEIYKGLVEVSCLINSITDYKKLLRAVLTVAQRVIKADAASLFLVEEDTGDLRLAIATRTDGEFDEPGITVPKGKGIVGWVMDRNEPLLISDAYKDYRFYSEADKKTGFTTRSILCAPLRSEGKTIGVLQVLNPLDKLAFEAVDLEGFTAYAELTATAIEKLRTLEIQQEQARVQRDLAIAADIQCVLLSGAIPAALRGVRFTAHSSPATEVGGDFYGVFCQGEDIIDFVIGDVSGKGIPAALLMARTLSALPFVFSATDGPAAALSEWNAKFQPSMIRGMFITAIAGRLIPSKRLLLMANAGHCQPILVRANGEAQEIETPSNLPVGITQGVTYEEISQTLDLGDRFVLFTDGLSESQAKESEPMFESQLIQVASGPHADPSELMNRILHAATLHRQGATARDDLSILVGGFE